MTKQYFISGPGALACLNLVFEILRFSDCHLLDFLQLLKLENNRQNGHTKTGLDSVSTDTIKEWRRRNVSIKHLLSMFTDIWQHITKP